MRLDLFSMESVNRFVLLRLLIEILNLISKDNNQTVTRIAPLLMTICQLLMCIFTI